jgi:putative membrane-bound dehydrogenase-like protein
MPALRIVFPLLCVSLLSLRAQSPVAPKSPVVNDSALRIELLVSTPEVEACTTVCGAPDGSFYVGNDPRDGRLSNSQPVNTIVRFSSLGAERKRTVFAEKIYSPAGSAWHDGFLYVLHDPLLTRFKDTDGDGIADVREDLVTNLGIPPNEGLNDHVVSGFALGMDGFFYISVGDRGIFEAKSVKDGSTITMRGGGIARCRTDGSQLEVFSTGTRNHLQVNLDAEDNAFTRDNTDDGNGWWTRLTHHIEGGYYGYPYDYRKAVNYGVVQPSEQTLNAIKQHGYVANDEGRMTNDEKPPESSVTPSSFDLRHSSFLPAMADFGGGSPTGGLCYLSDGLPEQYRGRHFFSEWGKAGIFVTEVARDGATFKLVSDTKLIEPEKGADFRPMQLSVAADGSLLIADWGYGGWKSPRVAGAIWRLSWPEAKPAPRLKNESQATVDELIAALGHPDRDQRLRAQPPLVDLVAQGLDEEWAKRVPPAAAVSARNALQSMVRDARKPRLQRIHALWVLFAAQDTVWRHDHGEERRLIVFLDEMCAHPDPFIRVQAVRAISQRGSWVGGQKMSEARTDNDPMVRLQVFTALNHAEEISGNDFAGKLPVNSGEMLKIDPAAPDPTEWFQMLAKPTSPTWIKIETDEYLRALIGSDHWVRFAATSMLARPAYLHNLYVLLPDKRAIVRDSAWRALGNIRHIGAIWLAHHFGRSGDVDLRTRAAEALGRIAYQLVPYDGHWWGTQPVKSAAPLKSVAWAGTPQALATLTGALSDTDTGVRLAAAKAFTGFILDEAGKAAGAALRGRLTAESDVAIRRQLIESLGVQKDAQAVDVFRQIALDEKADADFRETAIGAVVNIGGDAAKKTIAQLADAQLSPAATRTIIKAAGELKVLEAAPALIAHLKDEDAGHREFAVKSLQQLGPKSNSSAALIVALADKDNKVQAAAVDALSSFREKAALPGIIALLEKKKALRETTNALVLMPDERAIPALVETLRDKNTTYRRNAIKALKTMREKAWPQVEALLATGRVPEELVPEIRNAFDSGAITKWKMIGVFENVWDAVHPPEKDVLANGGVANLAAKYHNAEGRDVGWTDVTADATEGSVDLEKIFKTNAMVCTYAFTEIDAPEAAAAKLFTSADDEIAVWLNGQQVLNQPGNHGYEPDKNETPLQLRAGKNQLFVKIGNKSGSWVFHARMPGFDNGKFIKSKETPPDEKQRLFALAVRPDGSYVRPGDAAKGEKLFFDPAGAMGGICATCHAVKGKGGQIGPDLSAIAANYKRADLLTSLQEPSKTIALGFEQVIVETNGGETVVGALRQETGDELKLVGADGQTRAVKKADVKSKKTLEISLMPPGLTLGLKPDEFTDLLAYLETLR